MEVHHKIRNSKFMNEILDDIFHPQSPICQVIPTSNKKKEDQFCHYRPQPNTCVDYNISQTDTKIDAGDTKIHYQQTEAEYIGLKDPPPLPPKKKCKYFSGGPPQWEFTEEIWARKQIELQKEYWKQFKKRVTLRKRNERFLMTSQHRKCVNQVGPAWYQELSPKQIKTVDNLKLCILKDLAENTIVNVQENIADLGLVLRPNHKHVQKALKNCCQCPIEFLLILYQLINPKRTKYSINDRLLLSGVVHLTMMATLKELHIRIPSPPPPPKTIKKQVKKKKLAEYDSPYLQPFTFEREPKKFTGIYSNKHVQKPQSPYFCYLKELKEMINLRLIRKGSKPSVKGSIRGSIKGSTKGNIKGKTKDKEPEENVEMEEEYEVAQKIYENLVDFRPVPLLLKASKYIPCRNFRYKQQLEEAKNSEEVEEEVVEEVASKSQCYVSVDPTCCDAETEITEELSGVCICHLENTCPCGIPKSKCCKSEETTKCSDEKTTCGCNFSEERLRGGAQKCDCIKEKQKSSKEIDDSSTLENSSPSGQQTNTPTQKNGDYESIWTLIDTVKTEPDSPRGSLYYQRRRRCKHLQDLEIYSKMYHLIRPSGGKEKKKCKCKEKHRKFVETLPCQCERCKEDRHKQSINYVISGLKETDENKNTVSIIDRVVEEKPCICLKKYNKTIEVYEKEKEEEAKKPCSCRKETVKLAKTPLCLCEKCEEDRRKKAAKYIIAGIKETEDDSLRVIEGTSMGKPCDCFKKYKVRVDEYEDFKKSQKVVVDMKQQDQKFIIGGLVKTSQGPQYVISGMRPPIDCICAKKARQEEAERHMRAIMPHPPRGRIQYGIVGVKETPERNIYILDNALPIDECDCMAVYQQFTEQHMTCMKLYEDYLAKMKDEYNQFMEEMLPPISSRRSSRASGIKSTATEDETSEEVDDEFIPDEEEDGEKKEEKEERVKDKILTDKYETKDVKSEETKNVKICKSCKLNANFTSCYYPSFCSCGNPYYSKCCECGKIEKIECQQCTCGGEVIQCVDCTCGPIEEEEEVVEEEETKVKRYFIFKKIKCNRKWQKKILKEALNTMAEDGYPLAKLPQVYKLPHFKLWMQMRCGKFWTQQDKHAYVLKSKRFWRHTNVCDIWKQRCPQVPVTREEASQLNWAKADYCRKLINEPIEKFYKKMRQTVVNFGREFFPSTFTYEFPFETWRDCYFAYTPTKEEDVLAKFTWKKHEYKHFADMQRFCN